MQISIDLSFIISHLFETELIVLVNRLLVRSKSCNFCYTPAENNTEGLEVRRHDVT